jgi:hypothetical protein
MILLYIPALSCRTAGGQTFYLILHNQDSKRMHIECAFELNFVDGITEILAFISEEQRA